MRRFFAKLFALVVLSSFCSTKVLGAGIEIETTVMRVFEDGSFETLEFPAENRASVAEGTSDSIQVRGSSVLDFRTDSEMTFDVLGRLPEQNPVANALDGDRLAALRELANVPTLLPASDEVVADDLLRYTLQVHNANAFAVPAYGLELIEHLPPGVLFIGLSAGQADWALRPSSPVDEPVAGAQEARQPPLRIHNTQILRAGARAFFSYDVVVQKPSGAELHGEGRQPHIDRVRVLDDANAQLQLQD